MSHESENSKTSAVVTHEFNTADFSQAHVRLISEFEPDPLPLPPDLSNPAMVVLTKNGSAPISDLRVSISFILWVLVNKKKLLSNSRLRETYLFSGST